MRHQCELLASIDRWIAEADSIVEVQTAIKEWAAIERQGGATENCLAEQEPYRQELLRSGIAIAVSNRLAASTRPTEPVLELFAELGNGDFSSNSSERTRSSVWDNHGVRLSGETFGDGRYAVYEPPVHSGQAEIWKAIDNRSILSSEKGNANSASNQRRFRVVALKRPLPEDLRSASRALAAKERLLKEARRAALLEHPNICPVYFIYEGGEDDAPFYTLRFLKDATLAEEIWKVHHDPSRTTPTEADWKKLVGYLVEAASGVAYAHKQGFVHLDLKPANIAVDSVNGTQVFDWGQASSLNAGVASDGRAAFVSAPPMVFDATQVVLSTPAYAAPEQIRRTPCAVQTDVFQLGATLFEVLTGTAPYLDRSQEVSLLRSALATPSNLLDGGLFLHLQSHRMRLLVAICQKAMRPCREQRYPSVDALKSDLLNWLSDEPVSVATESILERSKRNYRKHRRTYHVGSGIVLMSIFLVISVAMWRHFAYVYPIQRYYRSFEMSPAGPKGLWPISGRELGFEHSIIRTSQRGWYGLVDRLEVLGPGGVVTPWSAFIEDLPSKSPNREAFSSAVDVTYVYRDGWMQAEEAKNYWGQVLWRVLYAPVYRSTTLPSHSELPIALTGTFTCFVFPDGDVGSPEVRPQIQRRRVNNGASACIVQYTWETLDRFSRALYFDERGTPAANALGEYGYDISSDVISGTTQRIFLDSRGNEASRSDNIVRVTEMRDPSTGKMLSSIYYSRSNAGELCADFRSQFNYDANGHLTSVSTDNVRSLSGFDKVELCSYEYDDLGRIRRIVSSRQAVGTNQGDISSTPVKVMEATYTDGRIASLAYTNYEAETTEGYDVIVESYQVGCRQVTIDYLKDDKPLATGLARIRHTYDSEGRLSRKELLQSDGTPWRSAEGYSGIACNYNGDLLDTIIYSGYDDLRFGFATQKCFFDDKGRNTGTRYYSVHGRMTGRAADDVAEEVVGYDPLNLHDHPISVEYFDVDHKPRRCTGGFLKQEARWKGDKFLLSRSIGFDRSQVGYFIEEEKPRDGVHAVEVRYLDEVEKPVAAIGGDAYGVVKFYDVNGLLQLQEFIDMNGGPAHVAGGYTSVSYQYPKVGCSKEVYSGFDPAVYAYAQMTLEREDSSHVVHTRFRSKDGCLVSADGSPIFGTNTIEDSRGRMLSRRFVGPNEEEISCPDGFREEEYIYSDDGTYILIRRGFEDEVTGFATMISRCNERGREIEVTFADENRKPIICRSGFAGYRSTFYNENEQSRTYFDLSQNVVPVATVVSFLVPSGQGEFRGLQIGDVIISYDDVPIENTLHLIALATTTSNEAVASSREVNLLVVRNGSIEFISVSPGRLGIGIVDVAYAALSRSQRAF